MDQQLHDTIVIAIAALVPEGKWMTADTIARLIGHPVSAVIEILDDEAATGGIEEQRVHDNHTLYRIPSSDIEEAH